MTKIRDVFGIEHEAKLISSQNSPYLEYEYKVVQRMYNPNYGDNRKCICGHSYYRHFDSYENMEACGCKYCGCSEFVEDTTEIKNKNLPHHCKLCGAYIEEDNLSVCDKCASEYQI
ncbi:hypothetical protein [Coprococcus sp. RTP21281st1_F1_RTP21281_210402]|uniref:hypothetical protein n=1 Tax=Coprococcus sp. RTP21281st1_F1_RTP21281_210402 TaxID=3143208 RepID=UPI0034A49E5E